MSVWKPLNQRLAVGGLEVSDEELRLLASEATSFLSADRVSSKQVQTYLLLFREGDPTLDLLESLDDELLTAWARRDEEIPSEIRQSVKASYAARTEVGGRTSHTWFRGIIATYLALKARRIPMPLGRPS
jgi:uncharacterized alpha-E superfamily protein